MTQVRKLEWLSLFFIVALAAVLRLSFPGDIEFKGDEAYSFNAWLNVQAGGDWPLLGMNSSVKIVNPGWSLWIFFVLGKLFSAQTPVDLSRAVQWLNILAFAVAGLFALQIRNGSERKLWLWGLALCAVNPLFVILHRKIWPQSVSAFFATLLFVCWWNRKRHWSLVLGWGAMSLLLGQFHMVGFFVAGGLFAWTCLFDRPGFRQLATFGIGALLGSISLWPWIGAVLNSAHTGGFKIVWYRALWFKFWAFWFTGTTGLATNYSLGPHYLDFVSKPWVALVHLGLVVCSFKMLLEVYRYWKNRSRTKETLMLWARGDGSNTDLLLGAMIAGVGLFMTLTFMPIQHHYFLAVFPLQGVWQARVFLRRPTPHAGTWLGLYVALLLAVSIAFLQYIHAHGGAPGGDYGVAYSQQQH